MARLRTSMTGICTISGNGSCTSASIRNSDRVLRRQEKTWQDGSGGCIAAFTYPKYNLHRMKPIIETGSNIPTLEEQPVAPVLRIDREEIDRSGAATVAEVLHRIPQNAGNQSFGENQAGSFSPATAAVSLRGFGPQSTLVLINGRRLPPTPFGD